MTLLHGILNFGRSETRRAEAPAPRRGMPKSGEPLGFFARLTAEQEQAVFAYRGDETVGDRRDMDELAKRR